MNELFISAANERDLASLATFMSEHGGRLVTEAYLKHWYFRNPSGSASVMIGRVNGRVVGVATTNDHYFSGPEGKMLVAMPQKVLTDPAYRGMGIFQRLYKASEKACLARGVSFFLTVTNKASTPIFLGRFGYARAREPVLLWHPLSFGPLPPVSQDDTMLQEQQPAAGGWRMMKDPDHYRWRYSENPASDHARYGFKIEDRTGFVFVKKIRKKGVPILLVLDMVGSSDQQKTLLSASRKLAWKHRCPFLLRMEDPLLNDHGGFKINSGFNLLVKGRDVNETRRLASEKFHLSFGDLDFF